MKFTEPKTFRDATSPVTMINCIFGTGTLEYPVNRLRRVLSLCWSAVCVAFLINCIRIADRMENSERDESVVTMAVSKIFLISHTSFTIMAMYYGQVRSKGLGESMRKIDRVNDMLSKLGIPTEYGSTFKYQIIQLIGLCIFEGTSSVHRIFIIPNSTSLMDFNDQILLLYVGTVIILGDYSFSSYVRYIKKRIEHLNVYLAKLNLRERSSSSILKDSSLHRRKPSLVSPVIESSKVGDEQRMVYTVRDARDIHRDLCSTANKVNEAFGVQLLFSVAMALTLITSGLFRIYSTLAVSTEITMIIKVECLQYLLDIGIHAFRIFVVVSACSMAATEAQRTGDLIHELSDPTTGIEIRDEVEAFSLQIMQNPLKFTACGFFTLDYKMIRAMVGTVTTYLVLTIQIPRTSNGAPKSTDSTALFMNLTD